MKFIKLTECFSNKKVLINMDLIDAVSLETDQGKPHAVLYRVGIKGSWYEVKEKPEQILELLK